MSKLPKTYRLDQHSLSEIIHDRLEALEVTAYSLAKYGGVDAAPSTVHRFLSGSNIFSDSLAQMLQACGLAIVVVDDEPSWIEHEETQEA